MADIDVVKKRTSVWPWIIGIILVVIGVILAILAAPAPAIASRRHFF